MFVYHIIKTLKIYSIYFVFMGLPYYSCYAKLVNLRTFIKSNLPPHKKNKKYKKNKKRPLFAPFLSKIVAHEIR